MDNFDPLESVTLPSLGQLKCSGLVLIVGPNSSGKSQLLQDIYARICGEPRALVVAEDIRVRNPEYEPFIKFLKDSKYIEPTVDDNGTEQWKLRKTYAGSRQPVNAINPQQARQWYESS